MRKDEDKEAVKVEGGRWKEGAVVVVVVVVMH